MKRLLITAALFMAPALARASDHASFHLSFSTPPTLAVIQPGVQVVVDHDEEVFYSGHRYWVQRDGEWFSARHHGNAFAYVPRHRVPAAVVSVPPGRYRLYHPAARHGSHSRDYGYDTYETHSHHGGPAHGHAH